MRADSHMSHTEAVGVLDVHEAITYCPEVQWCY